MLEHPPIANAQEKSESLKTGLLAEVQSRQCRLSVLG